MLEKGVPCLERKSTVNTFEHPNSFMAFYLKLFGSCWVYAVLWYVCSFFFLEKFPTAPQTFLGLFGGVVTVPDQFLVGLFVLFQISFWWGCLYCSRSVLGGVVCTVPDQFLVGLFVLFQISHWWCCLYCSRSVLGGVVCTVPDQFLVGLFVLFQISLFKAIFMTLCHFQILLLLCC